MVLVCLCLFGLLVHRGQDRFVNLLLLIGNVFKNISALLNWLK